MLIRKTFNIRIVRKLHGFSAFLTRKGHDLRKTCEQVHRPAMWACGAAEVERQFHFCERLLDLGGGNTASDSTAFVAHNVGLISAYIAIQTKIFRRTAYYCLAFQADRSDESSCANRAQKRTRKST
jgi:hypothetical protein